MDASDRDLALRVDMLERTLDEMQRELTRLRRRRRVAPALALAVAGTVALAVGGRTLDAQGVPGQKVTAPFMVVDTAGKTILEVLSNDGRPTLHIGDQGGVWIGRGKSGVGFLAVQRSNGTNAITLGQPEGGTLGVQVFDESGKTVFGEVGLAAGGKSGAVTIRAASGQYVLDGRSDSAGHPVLSVGEKGGVWLGSGASGAGFVVTKHFDNTDSVALGMFEGGHPGVRVLDMPGKRVLAELAETDGDAGGSLMVAGASGAKPTFKIAPEVNDGDAMVVVTGGTKGGDLRIAEASGKAMFRVSPDASAKDARVSIGAAASGAYAVHVANASGTDVGGFGEAKVGGGVLYVADGSGVTRMLLSGTGQLHAADASGATRATMTSDGAFSIRSASGTTIARLGEGNAGGLFQLANSGGNAMVDAGVLPSGAGAVRAYPLGSPSAGLLGMPGTFIMGRK